MTAHDDVMVWKPFPYYWPFVRGIHQSQGNSPQKGPSNVKIWCSGWHYQMEPFSVLLALCVGNSPVTGEITSQRPVTRSFGVFFDLRLNKWSSKQSWGWTFQMLLRSLWLHCNALHRRVELGLTKGQYYRALMFSLLATPTSCWINSPVACYLICETI